MYDPIKNQIKHNQDIANHLGSCAFKNQTPKAIASLDDVFFAALKDNAQLKRQQEKQRVIK